MEQRYSSVLAGLGAIKCQLSNVYGSLSGGAGDADLLFTPERHLLFGEGVLMSVRCDSESLCSCHMKKSGMRTKR
jgi:hypothetical protein